VSAAPYVLGAASTNACAAGSAKITDVAACRAAAAFVGIKYGSTVSHAYRPGGCFFDNGKPSKVDLNPNATGAAASNAQPLCQVAGAPRVRLCVYSIRVITA
jgi:hypothetical protein